MTSMLPPAAMLAVWVGAWMRGQAALDDLLAHLEPPPQVVTGVPGADSAQPLGLALGALRSAGATGVGAALPRPGDPLGLAGPPLFNAAAIEAGGAVLFAGTGLGLTPATVGGAVEWRCSPAHPPPWSDLGEADSLLRQALLDVTTRLVDLDVASWQPAIPDALMNLRHRPTPPLPPRCDQRRLDTVRRALLCLDVVRLAGQAQDGAITAGEVEARRRALTDLDRAARRGLVAACSSLG